METSFVDAHGRFTAKLLGGGDVRNMSFLEMSVSETLSAPSYSSRVFLSGSSTHCPNILLQSSYCAVAQTSFSRFLDKLYMSWTWQTHKWTGFFEEKKWLMQNFDRFSFNLIFGVSHKKFPPNMTEKLLYLNCLHFNAFSYCQLMLSWQKCR